MYKVISFYKYIDVENPESFAKEHLEWCIKKGLKGKVYIAKEGISGSIFGSEEKTDLYKSNLKKYKIFEDIWFKETETDQVAFPKMHVRVKEEIVNSGLDNIDVKNGGKKLSPEELIKFYNDEKDFVIVDARNWYESKIGRFKNALAPDITHFREWPKVVESLKQFKDKTVITYCTGGIRCEKASAYMIKEGFKDVYQLEGGIINFINKYPDTYWLGSMFVFDDRKVVEPNTKEELKYIAHCEFCGKPTSYYINCHHIDCDKIIIICHDCKVDNDYCCSEECRNAENRRDKFYG
ncbi:MAG TPA: rhodanese-related sulfurtransferase [Ignavibacteriaceae bacterium]|nr:rhodanese-related sulfurtransferase [Ignavibacteriaceae bacterium]